MILIANSPSTVYSLIVDEDLPAPYPYLDEEATGAVFEYTLREAKSFVEKAGLSDEALLHRRSALLYALGYVLSHHIAWREGQLSDWEDELRFKSLIRECISQNLLGAQEFANSVKLNFPRFSKSDAFQSFVSSVVERAYPVMPSDLNRH